MDALIANYGWGLFVTLNPCVLPILPFVILSALNVSRWGPVALSAGMVAAYTLVLGTLAFAFGELVGDITGTYVSRIGAVLLIAMGVLFVVPQFYAAFTGFLGRFTTGAAQAANDTKGTSLREQFLIGALLAIAWVPCAAPAIIGNEASGGNGQAFWASYLGYFFFGLGAVTLILILGLGARTALISRRNAIAGWVKRLKPILGCVLILIGLLILTGLAEQIEAWFVNLGVGRFIEGFGYWLEEF